MDFRHLIVTCLFSMLRLSFETQKIKENYAILFIKTEKVKMLLTVLGHNVFRSPVRFRLISTEVWMQGKTEVTCSVMNI